MVQLYEFTFVRRQLVERSAELPCLEGALDVGWLGDQRRFGGRRIVEVVVLSTLLAAMDIDGHPAGNRGQPRAEFSAGIE